MQFYWLILGALVVWRITHLLQAEDGPGDIFVRMRRSAGEGFWGKLLDCFYCLSLWISIPFAWLLGGSLLEQGLLWPALSTGAIIIERLTESPPEPVAPYWEDEEEDNGMLRQTETEAPDRISESGDEPHS